MTTLDVLWSSFESDPFDPTTAGALADLLEESGEDALAAAVRWMRREGKRPFGPRHQWYDGPCPKGMHPPSDIPSAIYGELRSGTEELDAHDHRFRDYPTFREAVADLAQALRRQPDVES